MQAARRNTHRPPFVAPLPSRYNNSPSFRTPQSSRVFVPHHRCPELPRNLNNRGCWTAPSRLSSMRFEPLPSWINFNSKEERKEKKKKKRKKRIESFPGLAETLWFLSNRSCVSSRRSASILLSSRASALWKQCHARRTRAFDSTPFNQFFGTYIPSNLWWLALIQACEVSILYRFPRIHLFRSC